MNYCDRKIDILLRAGHTAHYAYECTTNTYPTCTAAKAAFLAKHDYLDPSQVKCRFVK